MKITPKGNMEFTLKDMKVSYEKEYRFAAPVRQFRFDFAIVDLGIGIEYEGIFFNKEERDAGKKSRHTNVAGYSEDLIKYNMATTMGWRILRYTANNYQDMRSDLAALMGLIRFIKVRDSAPPSEETTERRVKRYTEGNRNVEEYRRFMNLGSDKMSAEAFRKLKKKK